MKILIGALALTLALPAFAQSTPAPATTQQHQGVGHEGHGNSTAADGRGQHHGGQHHEGMDHGMNHGAMNHGAMNHDGCCADRDGNGRMDCCDEAAAGTTRPTAPAPQPQVGSNR